tara:strand:+ start:3196 stop:4278 length:1083 start_codon:yes stop_codon:yes gene_type:complete
MRIGLMLYGDIDTLSGGYLYDRKLLEYCRLQHDEVFLFSLKKSSYIKALTTNTIPVELNDLELDVLIQDELIHPSVFRINHKLKQLLNCPIVSLVHLLHSSIPAPAFKRVLYKSIERLYLKSVDAMIFNSEHTKLQARELLDTGLPANIVAVPCGDNFGRVRSQNKVVDSKALKILFVANISKQKGLHVVLEALYLLNDEDITLSVVGRTDIDRAYVAAQLKYIKNSQLENEIKFYGPIRGTALAQLYQEHDLFVLPSVNEAYGIVYLEAMQFALPVIATYEGGAKELVENNNNGYLVPAEDSHALAKHIKVLKQDAKLLAEFSENARQSYLQHPRWEDSINNIRQFLLQLVDSREHLSD